jgi:predicted transcriptional regulator/transcriptional regulator with XRE-family HTH domain
MARQLIGYRIRERRRQLGLTQASVAKSAGISPSYLNLIEANKRPIAGVTLRRITDSLDLDPETLTGRIEDRMIDDLVELTAEPMLRELGLDETSGGDLVGRHPAWASALLTCWRAYRDQAQAAIALSDRLNQDPALADAVHQMLTHVTTVRSTSEILDTTKDLDPQRRQRFHAILSSESARLSAAAEALATFFDKSHARSRSMTAADEVDDIIIERGNYFPAFETAAEILVRRIRRHGGTLASALPDYLAQAHDVTVMTAAAPKTESTVFRNLCTYHPDERILVFLDHAPSSTRVFQMARLAAELGARDTIKHEIKGPRLTLATARAQAFRAFASYIAGAIVFPYDRFLSSAIAARYDIQTLRQGYGASFEQVAHRLVTLRRPNAAGIPFGFLRTNPAGYVTKKFPLPGLPLPSHGYGCPLWVIYAVLQSPGRVLRQVVQFPNNARYLFVAGSVAKQPAAFHNAPVQHAVMLACEALHADKTVYADGLNLADSEAVTTAVGPSCRLCPRMDCLHRAEEPIVGQAPAA